MSGVKGYREFEFDLLPALREQVVEAFEKVPPQRLDEAGLKDVPNAHGVYMLLWRRDIVYIGKTNSKGGLKSRLLKHSRRVRHRVGLDPSQVEFKALRILVFNATDLEAKLIGHYRKVLGAGGLPWNGGGFGSNDPGGNRDKTSLKPAGFDARFPIDIDCRLDMARRQGTLEEVVDAIRSAVPYTVRCMVTEQKSEADKAFLSQAIDLGGAATMRTAMKELVDQLPPNWQATALAGRVVVAPRIDDTPQGEIIARSPGSPPIPPTPTS